MNNQYNNVLSFKRSTFHKQRVAPKQPSESQLQVEELKYRKLQIARLEDIEQVRLALVELLREEKFQTKYALLNTYYIIKDRMQQLLEKKETTEQPINETQSVIPPIPKFNVNSFQSHLE